MIEWIYGWVEKVPAWNTTIALFFYWIPLVVCAIGYTARTVVQINIDVQSRLEYDNKGTPEYYRPIVTVGTLFTRLFATITPVVNLLAAIFSVGYDLLRWIGTTFADFFSIALVPKRKIIVAKTLDGDNVNDHKRSGRSKYDPMDDL